MPFDDPATALSLPGPIEPIPHRYGSPDFGVMSAGDLALLHASAGAGGGLRLVRVTRQKLTEDGRVYMPHIETLDGKPTGYNEYSEQIVGFIRGAAQ